MNTFVLFDCLPYLSYSLLILQAIKTIADREELIKPLGMTATMSSFNTTRTCRCVTGFTRNAVERAQCYDRLSSCTANEPVSCIDGDTEGGVDKNGNDNNMCFSNNEPTPWFSIDFTRPVKISKVVIFNRKDCCGEQTKKVSVKVGFVPPRRNCLWCLSGRQYTYLYNRSHTENRLVSKKPTCSEYLSDHGGVDRGSKYKMLHNCSSDGPVPLPLLGRFEGPAEDGQKITVKGKTMSRTQSKVVGGYGRERPSACYRTSHPFHCDIIFLPHFKILADFSFSAHTVLSFLPPSLPKSIVKL